MVSISYDKFDLIYAQLSEGNTNTFSSIFGILSFRMKGSFRVSRTNLDRDPGFENYGASSNQVHGSTGSSIYWILFYIAK